MFNKKISVLICFFIYSFNLFSMPYVPISSSLSYELDSVAYSSGDESSDVSVTDVSFNKEIGFGGKEIGFRGLVKALNNKDGAYDLVSKIIDENPLLLFKVGAKNKTVYDYIAIAEKTPGFAKSNLFPIRFICLEKQVGHLLDFKSDFSKKKYRKWKKVLKKQVKYFRKVSIKYVFNGGEKAQNKGKLEAVVKKTKKL